MARYNTGRANDPCCDQEGEECRGIAWQAAEGGTTAAQHSTAQQERDDEGRKKKKPKAILELTSLLKSINRYF